jgi:hypothetical protein
MIKVLCFILFLTFPVLTFSQSNFKQNIIYLEAGGNGMLSSLNYERQLSYQPGLGLRVGAGFYAANPFQLTIPVGINYIIDLYNRKVFADLGLSVTYTQADVKLYIVVDRKDLLNDHSDFNYIPSAGIRMVSGRNLFWRLSLTPIINHNGFIPWLGFSFGKTF